MFGRFVHAACVVALAACCVLAAGCRTSPGAASRDKNAPAPGPSSITWSEAAIAADVWTTPQQPEPPVLYRRGALPGGGPEAESRLSSGRDPRAIGPGTGVERRTDGGYATAGPWEVFVNTTSIYLLPGELPNGENGIGTWINRVRVSFEKPLDNFGRVGLNATYALRSYFFDGSNSLIAGTDDPFDHVHTLLLGANIFQPVSESLAVLVSADVSASAEIGADLLDAISWSVTVGGGYRVSESLDIGAGAFIASRFEEDLLFFGGPQFTWRPLEKWKVELLGPRLSLTYSPNEVWEWGIFGGFASARFRLKEEAPGLSQIFTDSRLPIYLQLRYRGSEKSEFEFRAGMDVYRDLVVEDARGNNGRGVSADPAPFFGVRWIQRL